MQIDRAYVEATLSNLRQQEAEAVEMLAKIRGAMVLADALLKRLDEKEPEPAAPAPEATPGA